MSDDMIKHIAHLLDNQTIIHLLVVCKRVHSAFLDKNNDYNVYNMFMQQRIFSYHYKNVFTSITIYPTDDLIKTIHRYMDHQQSIQKTILYDNNTVWPFKTKEMVYITCA
jgi:hypothetical protein